MDNNAKRLVEIGDSLFSALQPWNSQRQEIAEIFYPMRADFTSSLSPGDDFFTGLMDSYTVQCRQTLGDFPHAVLRQGTWFKISTGDEDRDEKPDVAAWLEKATEITRKFIGEPTANFDAATVEADHDWVTFGNSVLSVEENAKGNGVIFRAWHPRDNAWMINGDYVIDHNQRTMMMSARNVCKRWKNCHQNIHQMAEKEPNKPVKIRHVLMPFDDIYGDDKGKRRKQGGKPYISLYVDCENQEILSEKGSSVFNYIIPRLRTIEGVPIGFSPYTLNCLPDGRMLQDLARILLEQGEKAIDPPVVAKGELFRDAVNLYAGGFSAVDLQDDERLQDKLMVLENKGQLNFGLEMKQDVRSLISESFLLNKLFLPNVRDMTAFETQARLDEYRRAALPFFGPIESQYHLPLLDTTFQILIDNRAFPPMPEELLGGDVTFRFNGPLNTLEGRQTIISYQETLQIVNAASAFDPTISKGFNIKKATDDAARGAGAKPDWFLPEDARAEVDQADAQAAELGKTAELVTQGALTAKAAGEGLQALQAAGAV